MAVVPRVWSVANGKYYEDNVGTVGNGDKHSAATYCYRLHASRLASTLHGSGRVSRLASVGHFWRERETRQAFIEHFWRERGSRSGFVSRAELSRRRSES